MNAGLSHPANVRDRTAAAARLDLRGGISIASARRALAQAFRIAGLDSPELDARVLASHAMGLDYANAGIAAERTLDESEVVAIARLAMRRLAREPVARILGTKEFWSLEFALTPATLVPRPETETVVEAALAAIDIVGPRTRALRVADLGTGSGALLIALLSELPHALGFGTDMNFAALTTARANAVRHGVAGRAQFLSCHFGAALDGPFDCVVANPPYIPTGDIGTLAPEVRDHDPILALDGGVDGLAAHRAIAADVARLLAPAGTLVVELGIGQHNPVAALLARAGLAVGRAVNDLAGTQRALVASRTP